MISGVDRNPPVRRFPSRKPMDELLKHLRTAEVALHESSTRHDPSKVEALLHDSFLEFGRSGVCCDRTEVLESLASQKSDSQILSQDFAITSLSADVALLTYRSANVDAAGTVSKYTLRASVWMRTPDGWKLRFHQGTPSGPFEITADDR